jgi:uncharacterized protein YjeT (DUF2065 family)
MIRTRLSLFYLAGYLIPAGLLLLFAPTFALRLLLSNGEYGDVFPRMAGMLLIGIGVLVVQIIRLRLEMLYTTTLVIRTFFCACFIVFYVISQDPIFSCVTGHCRSWPHMDWLQLRHGQTKQPWLNQRLAV